MALTGIELSLRWEKLLSSGDAEDLQKANELENTLIFNLQNNRYYKDEADLIQNKLAQKPLILSQLGNRNLNDHVLSVLARRHTPEYKQAESEQLALNEAKQKSNQVRTLAQLNNVNASWHFNFDAIDSDAGVETVGRELYIQLSGFKDIRYLQEGIREALDMGASVRSYTGSKVYSTVLGQRGSVQDLGRAIVNDYGSARAKRILDVIAKEKALEDSRKVILDNTLDNSLSS